MFIAASVKQIRTLTEVTKERALLWKGISVPALLRYIK